MGKETKETKECSMFVLYVDGKPIAYRYGKPWVSQQLLMEGGYPSEEEAIEAWRRENDTKRKAH